MSAPAAAPFRPEGAPPVAPEPGDADDGDDVAMAADAGEPDLGTDDDDEGPGLGGIPESQGDRRRLRHISPATKALLAKAAAALKAQRVGDDDDGMEPAIVEGDESAAAAQAAAKAKAAPVAAPEAPAPPAEQPAAAGIDPRVVAQFEQLNAAKAQHAAREAALAARERAADEIEGLASSYLEKPAETLRALLKKWTGAETDEDLKGEVADLVTELSGSVLGIQLSSDVRTRLDSRKALKAVKAGKGELTKREQALKQQEERSKETAAIAKAKSVLAGEMSADATKAKFPFLAAEGPEDAAALIWDTIVKAAENGEQLTPEQAARKAEDHIQKEATAWLKKRSHLFTAAPATAPAATKANESAPQGDPQGLRRSRTLTNAQAAAPTGVSPDRGETFDNEAHRNRSKAKLRAAFKPPT